MHTINIRNRQRKQTELKLSIESMEHIVNSLELYDFDRIDIKMKDIFNFLYDDFDPTAFNNGTVEQARENAEAILNHVSLYRDNKEKDFSTEDSRRLSDKIYNIIRDYEDMLKL